ncbi:MAG: glucosamine-6-phosphate deaminase [Fusobacteria bacterium]|nr:glucosamine-6-phosphate deaminase [Fusobacteriota bacterium]
MRLVITQENVGYWAAVYVSNKINAANATKANPFVLGLPTGGTPLAMYKELIKFNKAGKVSFENVITFNMDEYVGIADDHPESYHYYMWYNFFSHIDIKKENVHILNGNANDLSKECEEYEKKIESFGGIDLFVGGVGNDGHIAFNEPGSSLASKTRLKTLTYDTVVANSRFFHNDLDQVPKMALTVGVQTLLDAKEVLILASGLSKALAVQQAVEGSVNHMWTITALQLHRKGIIVCDESATMELKVKTAKYFKELHDHLSHISIGVNLK